jgi:carbamate kinase
MIGYLLEQELANALNVRREIATLLTRVEVDGSDPAFEHPTKPIGPVYTEVEARRLAARFGWHVAPDGPRWYRRVVPSPEPRRVVGLQAIRWLIERGAIVIAAGGGGIPIVRGAGGRCQGVEAVIDKDRAAALLALELDADLLVIATDVDAVFADWGMPGARALAEIRVAELAKMSFAAGSMGPKVEAACAFASASGRMAAIGALEQIGAIVAGKAGTRVQR